jgi:hypothetical protein
MREKTDEEFSQMYRMSRTLFYGLLEKIKDKLEPSERGKINAINSSGSYISAETKLAVTIRWLAGGIHQDICDLFGLSTQNFFHEDGPLWPTIEAINQELVLGFPTDENELDKISEAPLNTQEEIREAYFKKAGPNWNFNDWARLIHVAFDKKHTNIITRINNVSANHLLLSSHHFIRPKKLVSNWTTDKMLSIQILMMIWHMSSMTTRIMSIRIQFTIWRMARWSRIQDMNQLSTSANILIQIFVLGRTGQVLT